MCHIKDCTITTAGDAVNLPWDNMNPWKTAARHRDAPIDPTITLTLGALVKLCKKLVSTIVSYVGYKEMTITLTA